MNGLKPKAQLVEFENGEQELHFTDQPVGEKQTLLFAMPDGWSVEEVEDGMRLTGPGERWRFRQTDGADLFVCKFLAAFAEENK